MIITIAAFITLASQYAYAQQWLQLGAGGGVSHAHLSRTVDFYQASPVWGFNGTVKAGADFRYIKFGAAIEAGNIAGKVVRQHVSMRTDDARRTLAEQATVAGSYLLPHIFVHGKLGFSNGSYIYLGPVAGMVMANSGLTERRYSTFAYGADAGFVFRLSQRLGMEITEGWRQTQVQGFSNGRNMQHRLDYFNTNVGVVYSFGK